MSDQDDEEQGDLPPKICTSEHNSNVTSPHNKEVNRRKRIKVKCPKCIKENFVIQLPRHLRNVHGMSNSEAQYARLIFNLRRDCRRSENPKYGYMPRQRVQCPVKQCYAQVRRLDRHLQTTHKMSHRKQVEKFGIITHKLEKSSTSCEHNYLFLC